MNHQRMRTLTYSAVFLALALILPFFTGQIPQIGSMLSPMHLPVMLCGFVCGGPAGLAVGFIAPLLRCLLFGMPPVLTALAMAFELAGYGFVCGVLFRLFRDRLPALASIYAALVPAMVAGRLVWGAAQFVILGVSGSSFPFSAFLAGAVLNALPAIVSQLILVPALVLLLRRARPGTLKV